MGNFEIANYGKRIEMEKHCIDQIVSYFTGKQILVTGASGYLATALINSLKTIDCTILRLSRKTSLPRMSGQAKLIDICGNIGNAQMWDKVIPEMDIIYHFAAQTSVYAAEKDPVIDFQINVIPTLYMLEVCKKHRNCPGVIFSGTATQVGMPETLPVSETHPDQPITIYDMHKLIAENYLKYYARQNVVKATCLRLANVYGPGPKSSSADRGVLNMMIRKALQGENLTLYGRGENLRDYVYVKDVVNAFLFAAMKIDEIKGRHCVIGSGEGHTLKEAFSLVAETVGRKTGKVCRVVNVESPKELSPINERNFVADSSSFTEITGWHPQYSLAQGIDLTVEKYLNSFIEKVM